MNSRTKGHGFERAIASELRDIFPDCLTSRNGNPQADQAGVDLVNTGCFSIQCKATERNPGYHDILKEMPQDGNYNVILHKRNRSGIVAVMSWEAFQMLLQLLKNEGVI